MRSRMAWTLLWMSGFALSALVASATGTTEVMPMIKAAPAAAAIERARTEEDHRAQLRVNSGLTELLPPRALVSQARTGAYSIIASPVLGMALVTQRPDLMLERSAP